MGEAIRWFFILIVILVAAFWVLSHYHASEKEALKAYKRRITALPARLKGFHASYKREREVGIEIRLLPGDALDRAVEDATRAGYVLESRSKNALTFVRREKPNSFVALFLLLFFLLPGILYLMFGSRVVRATLAAFPNGEGSRLVIGGDDSFMVRRLTEWARGLRP